MQIDEKINELQNLIKRKITRKEIADILGLGSSQAVINRVVRKQPLAEYEILKLEEYFKNEINKQNQNVTTNDTEETVSAYIYPEVFGSCGNGTFELSQERYPVQIPKNYFFKEISPVKTYSVINAYGESMNPTINDGDKLIVEHLEAGEQIQDNRIYVFSYEDRISVKRLIYNVDEIIIKSDNPDPIFKVKYIPKDNMDRLIIIGQIVGLMRDCR